MPISTSQDSKVCPACKRAGIPCQIWIEYGGSYRLSYVRCVDPNIEGRHLMTSLFDTAEEFEAWCRSEGHIK